MIRQKFIDSDLRYYRRLLLATLGALHLLSLSSALAAEAGTVQPSAPVSAEYSSGWEQQRRSDTASQLRQRQIERLDAWLNAGQARYESKQLEDMELWRAYSTFSMVDEPALEAVFDEWVSRRPGSYAARVARGSYFMGAGWRSRGNEYASQTPPHRFARMQAYFGKARADFEAALKLTAKPTTALAALINIDGTEGDRARRETLLAEALRIDPGAQSPRYEHIGYLVPKWGGSYAEMEGFVEASRGRLDAKHLGALAGMIPADQANEMELAANRDPKADPKWVERALTLVDQAVALGPGHAAFHGQRAGLLAKIGRKTEALESFGRALELSDAPGHTLQRGMLFAETGRQAEAVADFQYAAELGDRYAQQRLGWGYRMGDYGLRKNPAEALKWFRRVAEWGDNYAQHMVGDLLHEGAAGKPDSAEAAKWYRLAAEDGYAPAQGNLGALYWNGIGVAQDRWAAMRWWSKAAAQGDANAQRNIDHLLNPLDKAWLWAVSLWEKLSPILWRLLA